MRVSPDLMTWHCEPPKPYGKGNQSLKENNEEIRWKRTAKETENYKKMKRNRKEKYMEMKGR